MSNTTVTDVVAWLGDAYGEMTEDQVASFISAWDYVSELYPDQDDQAERDAMLSETVQRMLGV